MSKHCEELWVAFVHGDKVAVVSHHLYYILVLFTVSLVNSLDCDLGQSKQCRKLVLVVLVVLCFIQTDFGGETVVNCFFVRHFTGLMRINSALT